MRLSFPRSVLLGALLLPLTSALSQPEPEQQADVRVLRLQITDAESGRLVSFVRAGEVVDLTEFRERPLTLVALTDPSNLGTVRFYVDGERVEQDFDPPYAIAGRTEDGDLRPWEPPEGEHTLIVVPISSELAPDASLSDAADRGEVGPWFEIETQLDAAAQAESPDGNDGASMEEGASDADGSAQEPGDQPEEDQDAQEAGDGQPPEPESEQPPGQDDPAAEPEDGQPSEEPQDDQPPEPEAEPPPESDGDQPPQLDGDQPLEPQGEQPPEPEDDPSATSGANAVEEARSEATPETFRLRWPLERMTDDTRVHGDVLLSRYPNDVVILAVNVDGAADPSEFRLSLKRNGCEAPGEHLVQLEPIDTRIGTSLTPIAASFAALRYGNFGVVVSPARGDEPLACATLALEERLQ